MRHAPTIAAPRLRPTLQSPRSESRVDVSEESEATRDIDGARSGGVGCKLLWFVRPIAANAEDGQADRRGNCRGVNRLEIGMCAVTLAWLAATTRGSPGARLSQPVERTANAKPAAVKHV